MNNIKNFVSELSDKYKISDDIDKFIPEDLKDNILFLESMFGELRRYHSKLKIDSFVNKYIVGINKRSLLPLKRDILFYYKDCITDTTYQNLFTEFPIVELKTELILAKCIKNEDIKSFKEIIKDLKFIFKDQDISYLCLIGFIGNLLIINKKHKQNNNKIINLETTYNFLKYFPFDKLKIDITYFDNKLNNNPYLYSETAISYLHYIIISTTVEILKKRTIDLLISNNFMKIEKIKSDFINIINELGGSNKFLESIENDNLVKTLIN